MEQLEKNLIKSLLNIIKHIDRKIDIFDSKIIANKDNVEYDTIELITDIGELTYRAKTMLKNFKEQGLDVSEYEK